MVKKTKAMQMKERFQQNIFICVIILKGDLKGFQEKFKTKDRIPPAVSGPYGENTARSRNQSDWRICRIPPAHELRKKLKMIFSHLKGAKKKRKSKSG